MAEIDPLQIPLNLRTHILQGLVTPRPIALVSSINQEGLVNLSPFSFFNLFSTNPPLLIFSPSRRARDNTTKHTLQNVIEVPEVVIHIVNHAIVQQTSLASCEYPREVNEFVKAGFTPVPSVRVKPPRVKEAPASFECKVKQVIPLGEIPGSGNLVICEVVLIHVQDEVLDEDQKINPWKLQAMARLGGDYYAHISGPAIQQVPKPTVNLGIGFDQLPPEIRSSMVLSGNDLGMLANAERLPDAGEVRQYLLRPNLPDLKHMDQDQRHAYAKIKLQYGLVMEAWKILLA